MSDHARVRREGLEKRELAFGFGFGFAWVRVRVRIRLRVRGRVLDGACAWWCVCARSCLILRSGDPVPTKYVERCQDAHHVERDPETDREHRVFRDRGVGLVELGYKPCDQVGEERDQGQPVVVEVEHWGGGKGEVKIIIALACEW